VSIENDFQTLDTGFDLEMVLNLGSIGDKTFKLDKSLTNQPEK